MMGKKLKYIVEILINKLTLLMITCIPRNENKKATQRSKTIFIQMNLNLHFFFRLQVQTILIKRETYSSSFCAVEQQTT